MLHSILLLLSLLSQPQGVPPADAASWLAHPLIAHALGGIDGHDLTNSREAFETNYAKGIRVFETDLMPTRNLKDLVAKHDWTKEQYQKFEQDEYVPVDGEWYPLSLEEFLKVPINHRYTPLAWTDLLDLLATHPDAFLVLDTKFTDQATVLKQYGILVKEAEDKDPALLNRVIPQLYHQDMLAWIESVHVFPSYIYTLYQTKDTNQQVIDFVRSHLRVQAITMAESRAVKSFVQSLNQAGARVFVHTVNSKASFDKYRKIGVFGVYTDFLHYSDIAKGIKGSWTAQPPLPAE
ncbi:phosphatidylinositol-specific phospholipase C/glycerophosphodiester phosphodiesterase family protein [Cohnella candidum]|uniref:Glycerophosphodiester phosphodiesterase n=1 Tax=Cohnella candidum TaxID=2674991 RepID=A0A3G3JZF0_9BACL|nr:phosphatidylinositol-specific phospholipase C/glycerophosphodiester phosphodiesterase family protein [Cohnella candidum]AYQ73630.1 glycerophosphodiester phosphodiesterase [Cohnella candidum]